jgi:hypothetical protein
MVVQCLVKGCENIDVFIWLIIIAIIMCIFVFVFAYESMEGKNHGRKI